MDLSDKTCVITGGSRGLGRSLVQEARKNGANTSFSYNMQLELAMQFALSTGSSAYQLSLGDAVSTDRFLSNFPVNSIDYFVANAGAELCGGLTKHTPQEIARIIGTNLTGNLSLVRNLITGNYMKQGGQITLIGSIAADGNHDQLAYSASKAGLRGAVETLSRYDKDVKAQNLSIKLIEPAFIRTEMASRALRVLEKIIERKSPQLLEEFKTNSFVLEPADAAERILALAVDPNVTGIRKIPEGADIHAIRQRYF